MCDADRVDDWTVIAVLEPDSSKDPRSQVAEVLEAFLAERGLSRACVGDDDIRIDIMYPGPGHGPCARRLMIRNVALS
jgi:hypothetical protein